MFDTMSVTCSLYTNVMGQRPALIQLGPQEYDIIKIEHFSVQVELKIRIHYLTGGNIRVFARHDRRSFSPQEMNSPVFEKHTRNSDNDARSRLLPH